MLVLAGRDFAPDGAAARSATEALGADGVVTLGEVCDAALVTLYRGAAALAHVAAHEGFGFPPLKALAHGCPVLAADIPVLHETLGAHAVFADRNDPGHVAAELDQLIATDTPALRVERISWAQQFRWTRHVADLLRCYRHVGARC